jgi:hypothetical protein
VAQEKKLSILSLFSVPIAGLLKDAFYVDQMILTLAVDQMIRAAETLALIVATTLRTHVVELVATIVTHVKTPLIRIVAVLNPAAQEIRIVIHA